MERSKTIQQGDEAMAIGVAVIGAGMAGRAHAAAYRAATSLYESNLPPVRLVSIGDVMPQFGRAAADRFGFERNRRRPKHPCGIGCSCQPPAS